MTTSSTTSSALNTILSSVTNGSTTSGSNSPLISAGQIDVTTLVSELMSVQSQPLTLLQSQETGVKAKLSAYGQEQSALASLQTATGNLSLASSFQAAKATTTGSGVSATVTGSPASANYAVTVSGLAQTQSIASAAVASTTTLGTGTLTLQLGSAAGGTFTPQSGAGAITVTIDSTNNTLGGIASAINSAASGSVTASVVTDANGSRLVLSSANTGASNAFTVTASAGLSQFAYDPTVTGTQAMTQTQAAADASFTVNGLALSSSTNSISTAINGVTLNLTQAPAAGGAPLQSQIQVAADPTAVTGTVNSFISAYNSLITLTNSLTDFNTTTNTASTLTGDSATQEIVSQLQGIVGGSSSAGGASLSYLAQVGITVNSTDGTLALDSNKFQAAFAANPSAVSALFTTATGAGAAQGFGVQLNNAVQQLSGNTGVLGAAQTALHSQVTYMDNQQIAMQSQLAQTQARLTQEYSQLNADLTAAQQQQVQLANELASLPG